MSNKDASNNKTRSDRRARCRFGNHKSTEKFKHCLHKFLDSAVTHGYFLILLPVGCVFLGMVSTLGLLCWTVYSQERRLNARLRSSFRTGSNINTSALRSSQRPQRRPTLGQRTARKRSCETMIQASLYVGVYVLTYIGPTVCLSTFYYQGVGPPRILSVVVHTIYPMGGALNILGRCFDYTTYSVCEERADNQSISSFSY